LMPKKDLVAFVQNAFVSLVPLKDAPVLNTSSPNKFFESLAAGVPVIQNTNGWIKDFIKEHKVGETLDPNDPEELSKRLIYMKDHPEYTDELGNRAACVAKKYFDQDYLSDKMLDVLIRVHEGII